jgi:branched-chain amino acid aminotransferase group I
MPDLPDPRNENILIHVGGELFPRDQAKVSVFDSVVQGGDAVWEGLRIYDGKIFQLDAHLDRMFDSAKAMAFAEVPPREDIKRAIFETLEANGMRDNCHIRLTLSRGRKVTSGMSPHFNQYGPCLIVLAEWKLPVYAATGIRLITASVRRNPPQCVDSKIHHNNLINNILAKIEANVAGVDDAVMLDIHGFVSETNATNIFVIKKGRLLTPHADACLPGITRGIVIQTARDNGIETIERNISLSEIHAADEAFTTGTMGELSPVLEVDGRTIGDGEPGPLTDRLRELYAARTSNEGEPLPF